MKRNIILFVIFLSVCGYAFEFGPLGFDKRIDTGEGYGEFIYTNSSDEVVRYKINIFSTGKENDISKYVSVYPKILTIKPQSTGKVKVFVEAPPLLKKGIYSFMMGSENVSVPFLQKNQKGKIAPAVSLKTSVGLEMQAYVGEVGNNFEIFGEKIIARKDEKGKSTNFFVAKLKNKTGRGYEIGIGFVDSVNSLIEVESKGRLNNNGELDIDIRIPELAKELVFYDYNNQVFVGQKLSLKKAKNSPQ